MKPLISKPRALSIVFVMLVSIVSLAATPSTAPKTDDMAVSGNLGFAVPFDGPFSSLEPAITGSFEYYTTPRISWRGLLGFTSFTADLPGDPTVDSAFVNASFVYNWERGNIHPFATAGIGVYNQNGSHGLPSEFDETVLGVNGGGGIDWFLGPRWGLKFEGSMHALAGEDPNTFLLGTAGVIFWF
jgi:hypothetical protein